MCLGIPAEIVKIEGETATVSYGSLAGEANISLLPEADVGDYVIIHAGFAIEKLERTEAEETLRLLEEIQEMG